MGDGLKWCGERADAGAAVPGVRDIPAIFALNIDNGPKGNVVCDFHGRLSRWLVGLFLLTYIMYHS